MSTKKNAPIILLNKDLTNNLDNNLKKIQLIIAKIRNVDNGFFATEIEINDYCLSQYTYIYSLFEGALLKVIQIIIRAIPNKFKTGDTILLDATDLKNDGFVMNDVLDRYASDIVKKQSKGDMNLLIKTYCETLGIKSVELSDDCKEITYLRNKITHENYMGNLNISCCDILSLCEKIEEKLLIILEKTDEKYRKYTPEHVFINVWKYIFSTPLLNPVSLIIFKNQGYDGFSYKFDLLREKIPSLSHSEKHYLIHIIQQYNNTASQTLLNLSLLDLSASVSISDKKKMALFNRVLEIYPYFFSGQ